jgi:outer membrane protein assembly factor BamA
VVQELIAAYNDSLTTRIAGNHILPAGTRHLGPMAVFRGSLRVTGELTGRVTVINGDLLVDARARISGNVLVVGGRIIVRPGGEILGTRREYASPALLTRTSSGLLVVKDPPRSLSELASARASLTVAHFKTDLSVETGRTYNRVEGVPIIFGPTITRQWLSNIEGRLDLRGTIWTAPDPTDRRSPFGYSGRLEFKFGESRRLSLGAQLYRQIATVEEQPLSATEAGWSAFLFQRDYRDFYQVTGVAGYASYRFGKGLSLATSLRRDGEQSVPANDPISLFRNDAWRPNPLVDDGHYRTWRIGLEYDTRNDRESPTAGWLLNAWWERSRSGDAAPLALPPEVRTPVPPGTYASRRIMIDARRYARINPSVSAALRLQAGGWVGGDPLPVQRRMSLGGPDLLPGYRFRTFNCAPESLADPSRPALCDRMIAVQLELRSRTRVGLPIATSNTYVNALQRVLGIREPDIVIFGDAGKSWITGAGPGRIPNNRIPKLDEWAYEVGFGFDAGGVGLYITQPMTQGRPLTVSLRLQRRY